MSDPLIMVTSRVKLSYFVIDWSLRLRAAATRYLYGITSVWLGAEMLSSRLQKGSPQTWWLALFWLCLLICVYNCSKGTRPSFRGPSEASPAYTWLFTLNVTLSSKAKWVGFFSASACIFLYYCVRDICQPLFNLSNLLNEVLWGTQIIRENKNEQWEVTRLGSGGATQNDGIF